MKTKQIRNNNGNLAANQFIMYNDKSITFQSYNTIIATYKIQKQTLTLDHYTNNMSRTTAKYFNIFINDTLRWCNGVNELRNAKNVKEYNKQNKTKKLN